MNYFYPMEKMISFFGIDKAIFYTLIGRGWGIFAGVTTLMLVVRYLSPDEQGFFYTFSSLLALQIFFELGMSFVVMQFASHEMANLTWTELGSIEGDRYSKGRIRSLILLATKWYGAVSVLLVLIILPLGWLFFSKNHSETVVHWQIAWTWLVLSSAVNIFFTPMMALFEGCGRITEIARLRMYQGMLGSSLSWIVLLLGGGLLAIPVMSTCFSLILITWLWRTKKNFFKVLLSEKIKNNINWKKDIWPFQWKIALSWLSGYFIFQLFTPVLFVYHGSIEAGKMGMSITIANALMSIAMAWMSTKVPKFGTLIAKKDYINLDSLFKLTFIRSFIVLVILGLLLSATNYLLHEMEFQISTRLLEPWTFSILILATIVNYVTYAQSTYLRAHKKEPFLLISIVSAALICFLTLTLVHDYGAMGLMFGYLVVSSVIGLGWGSVIFFSKRREWQKGSGITLSTKA